MSADKTAPTTEDAQASIKPHEVGTLFAATYANMVNTEGTREHLYRLYGPDAEFSHVTPEGKMSAKTVNAIKEQLGQKKSLAANIEYTSVHVQEGHNNSIVVLCAGIQTVANKPRTFSQVFVLVPQPEGFYCNNDIFTVLYDASFPSAPVDAHVETATDAVSTNGVEMEDAAAAAAEDAGEASVAVEEATPDAEVTQPAKVTSVVDVEEPAPAAQPVLPDAAPAPVPPAVVAAVATASAPAATEAAALKEAPVAAAPVRTEPMSYASLAAQPKSARPPAPKPAEAVAPAAVTPAAKETPEENGGEPQQASKPAQQRSQDRSRVSPTPSQNQVFIRPIKQGTQDALSKIFAQFGQVEKVQLKEQGFGFVTFSDAEAVSKAIAAGEIKCEDQRVIVESMKPQKPGSAGSRGRGRNVRGGRAPMRAGDRMERNDAQGGRRSGGAKAKQANHE